MLRVHVACVLWPSAPQGPEEQEQEQEREVGPRQEVWLPTERRKLEVEQAVPSH